MGNLLLAKAVLCPVSVVKTNCVASFPGSPLVQTKNQKEGESLVKFIT